MNNYNIPKWMQGLLIISVMANCILGYMYLKATEVDRSPPWHPFQLNSELTLESIVEEGYRFTGAPCGQVQFDKQVGNTTIQYEVELDCLPNNGALLFLERLSKSNNHETQEIEEVVSRDDPYYPYTSKEVKRCPSAINWRYFKLNLGSKIDSSFIRSYVSNNGGRILEYTEQWNATNGGRFMVYHKESELYFDCSLSDHRARENDEPKWVLSIYSHIPAINQRLIKKREDREAKIRAYHSR